MDDILESENFSLRQQLEDLLFQARQNEEKMRRFDQLERQLISSNSLVDLIHLLLSDYKQAFGLESVALQLVDREYEAARIIENEAAQTDGRAFHELSFIQSPRALDMLYRGRQHPQLASFSVQHHGKLFAQHDGIESVALLPLVRQNELIGSLHLGSSNPRRYTKDAGTAFLERLANIVAVCLESALTQERLKRVGLTDGLTGVQNRRYFEHRCPVEVSQAIRHQQALACMFLDIDKFKRINDSYGHQTGDAVLRAVAKLIQGQLRTSDTIARFGGEEFVVLLPQTAGHYAYEIAERIRLAVAKQEIIGVSGEAIPVTISIGLAMLPHDSKQIDIAGITANLIEQADKALYDAKHNGRNQVIAHGITRKKQRLNWPSIKNWSPLFSKPFKALTTPHQNKFTLSRLFAR